MGTSTKGGRPAAKRLRATPGAAGGKQGAKGAASMEQGASTGCKEVVASAAPAGRHTPGRAASAAAKTKLKVIDDEEEEEEAEEGNADDDSDFSG